MKVDYCAEQASYLCPLYAVNIDVNATVVKLLSDLYTQN